MSPLCVCLCLHALARKRRSEEARGAGTSLVAGYKTGEESVTKRGNVLHFYRAPFVFGASRKEDDDDDSEEGKDKSKKRTLFRFALYTVFLDSFTRLLLWIIVYRDYDRVLVDFGKNKG